MKQFRVHSIIAFILFVVLACNKEEKEEAATNTPTEQPFGFTQPSHFPPPHYTFENNPLTKEGFELGRKLFFDPILSIDNSLSCGVCHSQVHAFADHGTAFSLGVDGAIGTRNSPALSNMAWYPSFMWDGGINHIEVMPVAPITSPIEMKETMSNVVSKLIVDPLYPGLFNSAFGNSEITDQKILFALAQYMGNLVSYDSRYDRYILGKEAFTSQELEGLDLFRTHCENCHNEPLTSDFSYRNNGLSGGYGSDFGRYIITQEESDKGKFKVPSLRNVALTYPYMHDGRILTLMGVIDHYSENIQPDSNTDPSLTPLNLTPQQKEALHAFLQTLTDYTYISNPLYAE